jgi:MinD-like ATPase involved in chromosome partitioning or flagellar assembly
VIVAVCSEKGAPGVTTLATALAMSWPEPRLLLEADPSGGDLTFRLPPPGARYLAPDPSVVSLAQQARLADGDVDPTWHSQRTRLGVAVIPGPPWAESWAPLRNLWPKVAARLSVWPGTVIVDLGRLRGHPGFALAQTADVVLLLTAPNAESYLRVRERAQQLAQALGGHTARRNPVGVVVRAGPKDKEAVEEIRQILAVIGSPVPVVGAFAYDESGIKTLNRSNDSAHLRHTALMRSAAELRARIQRMWPSEATDRAPDPGSDSMRTPVQLRGEVR